MKLTATVITLNEERNIERCITSLIGVADEIIVLDAHSTDATCELAEKAGAIVRERDWEGYAQSKNYLNGLASHTYILSIDADEALDEALKADILKAKEVGFSGAYSVNRLTNYCGRWIRHSGWYPDVKVRLFPKEETHWSGKYVHEELELPKGCSVKQLNGHLLHYSYYNQQEHRARADQYSALTAKKMHAKGKKAGALKPYLSAFGRFFSMFFLKLGFLDGRAGWNIATISAASNVFKYKELRRIHREQSQ